MATLRRILKYTPAVVLGLLMVAWFAASERVDQAATEPRSRTRHKQFSEADIEMNNTNDPSQIVGTYRELDGSLIEQVKAFMAEVVRAYAVRDAAILEDLSHPGEDPAGRTNSRDFHQILMDGGDKVRGWSARPYTEPKWEVMETDQHHPPPSVWVDVMLNDGVREQDYPIYFALAPDSNGALRACYYVDREKPRK